MTVKMGAPMPPNPMMPRQPMNPLPPPMPVPPIPQAAGIFPVSANKRKRFGDSLETMLSRPPMVASDQMANMNVFTGQMMNTAARPPVVQQMRGGGNVRQMYRDAYSSPAFKSYTDSKKNTFAPTAGTPGRAVKTHDQIMAEVRSRRDNKPKPVAVTRDDDYTPTSAELNEQMKDLAAVGMPDLRQDQSVVQMPVAPDVMDQINQMRNDSSASMAMLNKYGVLGQPDDRATILAPGTGGLSSVPPVVSIPSSSSTLAQNMITFPESPDTSMQPGPAYSPSDMPNTSMTAGPAYSPSDMPNTGMTAGPAYLPLEAPLSAANIDLPEDVASSLSNLGLGDPDATQVGSGRGDPDTIPSGGQTGTGEEDDRSFIQKFVDDITSVPGKIMNDIKMGIDAGFYTDFEVARERLMNTGKYTKEEVDSWIQRTKDTVERNKLLAQSQSTDDDDGPMSTSPVDPCPPGFKLDPASGICVPVEEAEEEGSSISLNRARDTEFNELDDIMKRIVKPVDDPVGMQAGGSVGLNRAADNFLAAMGA